MNSRAHQLLWSRYLLLRFVREIAFLLVDCGGTATGACILAEPGDDENGRSPIPFLYFARAHFEVFGPATHSALSLLLKFLNLQ
jgi:hypothetical protein